MIPAPFQFEHIYREASLHPDVAAEIEAARRRSEGPMPTRRNGLVALLRRINSSWPTRNWLHVPAE